MSDQKIITAVITIFILTACIGWLFLALCGSRKKIDELRSGQANWRDIAFHHQKESDGWKEACQAERRLNDKMQVEKNITDGMFREIAVLLWGNPPLSSRDLRDAINMIQEIIVHAKKAFRTNEGLKQVVQQQDAELKGLREKVARVTQEHNGYEALVSQLVGNRFRMVSLEPGETGNPRDGKITFVVYDFDDTRLGVGGTMGEALEDALIEKRRKEEGLNS